jgi:hypothetical protein
MAKRALETVRRMMTMRGYECADFTKQHELWIMEAHRPGNTARVVFGVADVLADVRRVVNANSDVDRLVVVVDAESVKAKYAGVRAEMWSAEELAFDPTDHMLVPVYTVERPADHPEKAKYPRMLTTDIQARFREWQQGTIVRVTYSDGTSTFRLIVSP